MANWYKTREGNAINLDLCAQLMALKTIKGTYSVIASFPVKDACLSGHQQIFECKTLDEATMFIEKIICKNHCKSKSEELAEILR